MTTNPDPRDPQVLTVYSAKWCGHCIRLKAQRERAGIQYRTVDVDSEPASLDLIASFNGGDWLIPTVVLPDGEGLVNPSLKQITHALTWRTEVSVQSTASDPLTRDHS